MLFSKFEDEPACVNIIKNYTITVSCYQLWYEILNY